MNMCWNNMNSVFTLILIQTGVTSCCYYETLQRKDCPHGDIVLPHGVSRITSYQACQEECMKRPTCIAAFHHKSLNLCFPKYKCDVNTLIDNNDGNLVLLKSQGVSLFRTTSSSDVSVVLTDGNLDTCVDCSPHVGVASWGLRMTCTNLAKLNVYYKEECDMQATIYIVGQEINNDIIGTCQENLTLKCSIVKQTAVTHNSKSYCVVEYSCGTSIKMNDIVIYNPKQPICEIK